GAVAQVLGRAVPELLARQHEARSRAVVADLAAAVADHAGARGEDGVRRALALLEAPPEAPRRVLAELLLGLAGVAALRRVAGLDALVAEHPPRRGEDRPPALPRR